MRCSKYIIMVLLTVAATCAWGQYNPASPAEPGAPVRQYELTLEPATVGSCSFNLNAVTSQTEGTTFWVQANAAANFTFINWTEDGEVISTANRFQYTMPSHAVKLVAHYQYTPNAPGEPAEPNIPAKPVYAPLYLTAAPEAGGSFNITSGNNYEVGTSVSVKANVASNFKFVNWTQDGEVISTSNPFNYTMKAGEQANYIVANYSYEPGSPAEPTQRLYHKVYLQSNPAGGGSFNVASGNEYEEGTQQTFRANNSQWYTFHCWTLDGEEVSTNSTYTFNIPTKDITLVAHFDYNYSPDSPKEPGAPTTSEINIYALTMNGVRGQTLNYPIYLENTSEVGDMTVVVRFPEGFNVHTESATLAERAAGKTLTVTHVDGNAYRFDITGGTAITGSNGKLFDLPVTIAADAVSGQSYDVTLTNGARINSDNSMTMVTMHSGYISVEQEREDGLYASFIYEKLQNRFKFTNQSSDKAVEWTWNFGDGTSSHEHSPMHIYEAAGSYEVTLEVKGVTGTDMAVMTVLVNDKATWRVDGTLFLDTEQKGVRYFTSAEQLVDFMSASPISGNVNVMVKAGETFGCALDATNVGRLQTIQSRMVAEGYTLTLLQNGEGEVPVVGFGNSSEAIDADVVGLFTSFGQNLVCSNVSLQLWGIGFNPAEISGVTGQTVISGKETEVVDFSPISTDLTFTWKTVDAPASLSGYTVSGTAGIGAMTIVSTAVDDVTMTYNVTAKRGDEVFCTFDHVVIVKPALVGIFSDLKPAANTALESTTVTLSWKGITNAVYDVYLWNAVNQRPATPMAEGITETTFTSANFCQDRKSYKWQVVARNATQQIESNEMSFSVHLLPNLHVTAINCGNLEAGTKATISWTVRNDGLGDVDAQNWTDYLWLVSDVYGGTNQTSCKLLTSVANFRALAAGEEYEESVVVDLDEDKYGSFYLLVASDMSTVTQIEWDKVGGSIVNPYQPVANPGDGEYAYLFATTTATGNKVAEQGETTTRSDNFFYKKVEIAMPQMNDENWNILKQAYAEMGNGNGWTNTWDFNVERHTVQTLPGVAMHGGKVVSINLSNNGLTGAFPFTLLTLPALETLNVSENELTGDIGEGMENLLAGHEGFTSVLRAVNISENNLSGNIGTFALPLTGLETLYASDNALSDVEPVINEYVTTLTLGNQTVDKVVVMDVYERDPAAIWAQIPTILLYDHEGQGYTDNIRLLCTDAETGWSMTIECQEDMVTIPKIFEGPVGKVIDAQVVDDEGTPTGNTLKVQFQRPDFIPGDVNGDGNVTMADANAVVNYFLADDKSGITNFNVKAADVNGDKAITMADANAIVNMFLGQ